MPAVTTLASVLESIASYRWSFAIFAEPQRPVSSSTRCAVLTVDDLSDAEGTPEFAQAQGMSYLVTVHQAQDVLENAREQKRNLTSDEMVQALEFYLSNDAFITF